ncbi:MULTISPECIES: DUF427 domain-containing protein [unclassified Bradyrhizobium]|uniref:DUF427 domain-containing protein n=1 Tax=unclassified Bradyrhizobium TaxID=2631580 RepID=UPI0028E4A323|nr:MULTISPECIES: DUF427 domain-containing protein [unclassified Bradyrhizobium]
MQRIAPGPGQESVWDYPWPPRLERCATRLRVVFAGVTIADSHDGYRVLETSHPPVYYIPRPDIAMQWLRPAPGRSFCEFKGVAGYWTLEVDGRVSEQAAWSYEQPTPAFAPIASHLAFYASRVDDCFVGAERVAAQEGDFYGGWITSGVVGPFKGAPGTRHW